MKTQNVSPVNTRYWINMLPASLPGTTPGDYLAGTLGLGFAGALLPLAIVLLAVLAVERKPGIKTQFFY
ncbi:MAG: hypothetical protein P4L43_07475 [Syntrophobacteraceae bacterium]|nr:hypothetical protein [Syntrophobacteraceae bacterium]